MLGSSPLVQPLQFKQSSLVRKKINTPFEFPKAARSAVFPPRTDTPHKNHHMAATNSTKFSFRSSSILSLNSHLFPLPTHLPSQQAEVGRKGEAVEEKRRRVEELRQAVSCRKLELGKSLDVL
jgi:hypothetical protein